MGQIRVILTGISTSNDFRVYYKRDDTGYGPYPITGPSWLNYPNEMDPDGIFPASTSVIRLYETVVTFDNDYVYTNNTLTNYYQGDGRWYFIRNGGSYAIQILSSGMINGVLDCNNIPTPTRTPSLSISKTPSITPSISISRTPTRTPSISISRTPTRTPSGVPTYRYTVDMYYCEFPYCSYSLGMAVIENTYQISIGSFFVYDSNTIMEIMNSTTSTPDYYTNFQNYLGYDNCNTACQNSQ